MHAARPTTLDITTRPRSQWREVGILICSGAHAEQPRADQREDRTYSSLGSVPSNAQSAHASCPSTSSQLALGLGDWLGPASSSRMVLADETGRLSQALSRKAVEVWWAESNEHATEPACEAGRGKLSRLRCGGLTGGGGPARERRRGSVVEGVDMEERQSRESGGEGRASSWVSSGRARPLLSSTCSRAGRPGPPLCRRVFQRSEQAARPGQSP